MKLLIQAVRVAIKVEHPRGGDCFRGVSDWRWLFETYGRDVVRDWVGNPARAAQLTPRVERFWTCVLLDKPHETPRWSGGNGTRVVPADALPDWWRTSFVTK